MANLCVGNLRVVAKNGEVLERIEKILKYNDDEFYISRCMDAQESEPYRDGDFWVEDFYVVGAWNCVRFFTTDEDLSIVGIIGYEKCPNGTDDFTKPIYGTAHLTNLCNIAKTLDCGLELYSTEPGCHFWEHLRCNHNGKLVEDEAGDYEEDDEGNGHFDIDCFDEYHKSSEIYGEGND